MTIEKVIITDCGSTTTKAILFENVNGTWKLKARGEAPTTVEKPISDVTIGVRNSFVELELNAKEKLVSSNNKPEKLPLLIRDNGNLPGVDLYLSTSSAGGGLQMLVSGIVKSISSESSQKAALGAGAIVLSKFCEDDLLEDYEKIEKIKKLKPDIFLLAGGFNDGDKKNVIEQAQILLSAFPKPRFGNSLKLPVIFAGNKDAKDEVQKILGDKFDLITIDNIRPSLEIENLKQAKETIHDIFLKHVMSHSPGYNKLLQWTNIPIMPTPVAVGEIIENYGKKNNIGILCVDIGGATTDVFSVIRNDFDENKKFEFTRTVSANLGMSYSIGNVLLEAGINNIKRWLDFEISDEELTNKLKNKMLRPTTLPQTTQDLKIEQAVAREALRLSFIHHKSFEIGTSKFSKGGGISNIFSQKATKSYIDIKNINLIIGSGGVLSHSPNRLDSAYIMIDAFNPVGIIELAVDSIFMLPHLGILSRVNKEAAYTILENDCLIRICHAIIPKYNDKKIRNDKKLASVYIDGNLVSYVIKGKLERLKLEKNKKYEIKIVPLVKSVDLGKGKNKLIVKEITANEYGLLLDGREKNFKD